MAISTVVPESAFVFVLVAIRTIVAAQSRESLRLEAAGQDNLLIVTSETIHLLVRTAQREFRAAWSKRAGGFQPSMVWQERQSRES